MVVSQVDLPGILSMNPLPLSQGVLISLLQQLACDISSETENSLLDRGSAICHKPDGPNDCSARATHL
ncbi:hypothetical protein HAX54_046520 [Datura stramonium]|uniref:Uncharacterized protein n=1 Tax=Datura stramonium TaxID=4076 RepID=A0ABS8WLY5_DATST|nr:hypothetical protein [Datura stramonium]